jgi:hypothetical protein
MLGTSLVAGFKYLSVNDWLSTRGVVEQVSTQIVSSKPSTSAITLRYAYEVNGRSYHNDRLRFGLNIASNNPVTPYAEGDAITVFYNPSDASDSVIYRDDTQSIGFGVIAGLVFIAFSILALTLTKKARTKN